MNSKSIKKKLMFAVIIVVVVTIVATMAVKTVSDILIRNETDSILINQAKESAEVFVAGQTDAVNEQITSITEKITRAATFTEYIYEHPDEFVERHNMRPSEFPENTQGITFHWSAFSEEDVNNEEILKEADMLSALEGEFYALKNSCPMIQSLYVATGTHINIGYDENVLAKVGGFYNPIEADAQWFLQPMQKDKIYVSNAYQDSFGRGLTVTVSAPYKVNGKVHGVIGADITIQKIEENILDIDMSGISGYAVLLAADRTPISGNGINEKTPIEDILGSKSDVIIKDMAHRSSNVLPTVLNKSDKLVVYNTIESTGWKLALILDEADIIAPTEVIDDVIVKMLIISLIISIALLAIMVFVVSVFCRRFTKPILKLTEDVSRIGDGNLDYKSDISTNDEIETLSRGFEKMTCDLKEYISNLTAVTAEKERIGAELDVAKNIQASMLPCIFPPFPDRNELDIYATMTPAKEVGGDFYDFFMIDEKRIAIVMADVSGKGVPAALFMVIGKTLIKDHSQLNDNLSDVFTEVNNLLCEANSEGLFITAFEGVLNLETGDFSFVNAGHEMPYIYHKNQDKYEPYKIKPGFVLAGMENMKFKSGSIKLEIGDKIFQYTDGVTEATDKNNCLYGMERLDSILNTCGKCSPKETLINVRKDIDKFVGDAPQFDDITMLCLEYKEQYHS